MSSPRSSEYIPLRTASDNIPNFGFCLKDLEISLANTPASDKIDTLTSTLNKLRLSVNTPDPSAIQTDYNTNNLRRATNCMPFF